MGEVIWVEGALFGIVEMKENFEEPSGEVCDPRG